jgi:hypothetical protein
MGAGSSNSGHDVTSGASSGDMSGTGGDEGTEDLSQDCSNRRGVGTMSI